jgi:hypothetical protein
MNGPKCANTARTRPSKPLGNQVPKLLDHENIKLGTAL